MNKPEREALQAYYAEAGSWAEDRRDGLRRSRRTAWIVAALASAIAFLEALALIILTPLKTVEPYTLLVDRQTGYVQALSPLQPQTVAPDTALTQSFLVQYVIAREGFDYATLQSDYRKVALWSGGRARSVYVAGMQANNPDSPLARYPRGTRVSVEVKSVTPLGTDTSMIRFDASRLGRDDAVQLRRSYVVVARYGFSGEPMSVADRFTNPLGFQVLSYRRSEEALPVTPPPAAAPVQRGFVGRSGAVPPR